MRELFLNKNNLTQIVEETVQSLKRGEVVVFPTETAYGLGADFFNPEAVQKVMVIKGRDASKALPVIVADLAVAEELVIFDDMVRSVAAKYWPGPLTMVLPFKLAGQQDHFGQTLGLRISSHFFCQALSKAFVNPIVSTSANISGRHALYEVAQIKAEFNHRHIKPDIFINAGNLPLTPPSTVVAYSDGHWQILRQGKINIE